MTSLLPRKEYIELRKQVWQYMRDEGPLGAPEVEVVWRHLLAQHYPELSISEEGLQDIVTACVYWQNAQLTVYDGLTMDQIDYIEALARRADYQSLGRAVAACFTEKQKGRWSEQEIVSIIEFLRTRADGLGNC